MILEYGYSASYQQFFSKFGGYNTGIKVALFAGADPEVPPNVILATEDIMAACSWRIRSVAALWLSSDHAQCKVLILGNVKKSRFVSGDLMCDMTCVYNGSDEHVEFRIVDDRLVVTIDSALPQSRQSGGSICNDRWDIRRVICGLEIIMLHLDSTGSERLLNAIAVSDLGKSPRLRPVDGLAARGTLIVESSVSSQVFGYAGITLIAAGYASSLAALFLDDFRAYGVYCLSAISVVILLACVINHERNRIVKNGSRVELWTSKWLYGRAGLLGYVDISGGYKLEIRKVSGNRIDKRVFADLVLISATDGCLWIESVVGLERDFPTKAQERIDAIDSTLRSCPQ